MVKWNENNMPNRSKEQVIFIINRTLRIGGVERKIADIATFLTENDKVGRKKFFLLLNDKRPNDPDEAVFFDTVTNSRVQVLAWTKPGLLNRSLPFFVFILWKTLMLRPHVTLAFLRWPSLSAVFAKLVFWWRRTSVIIAEDCLASKALESEIRNRSMRCVMQALVRTFYPLANVIISPSSYTKQDLLENFAIPPQKVIVNRNWTVVKAPDRHGVVDYDLIYVGRVDKIKNIPVLVDIIREVVKKLPNIRVCVVGAGDDLNNVVTLAEIYNLMANISFVGFQKDVGSYLSRSKIFCLTSHHEGLPIAALEAMAHSLPVVTMEYPGVNELVVSGKTGFICDTEHDYRDSVIKLLTDRALLGRMGARARQHIESYHSLKNLKHFLDLIYNSAW